METTRCHRSDLRNAGESADVDKVEDCSSFDPEQGRRKNEGARMWTFRLACFFHDKIITYMKQISEYLLRSERKTETSLSMKQG